MFIWPGGVVCRSLEGFTAGLWCVSYVVRAVLGGLFEQCKAVWFRCCVSRGVLRKKSIFFPNPIKASLIHEG